MFTQENIVGTQKGQHLFTALFAASTLVLLNLSNWVWTRIYLQMHTVGDISAALFLMVSVIIVGCLISKSILGAAATIKLVNLFLAVLLIYVGFSYLRQLGFINTPSTELQKFLFILFSIISILLISKLTDDLVRRIYFSCIIGGFIFVLFPVILANLNAKYVYWPTSSTHGATSQKPMVPKQNTIILLLDEFSASAVAPIVTALELKDLHVNLTKIDPAGKNTLNVIPSIWTRKNFDQSIPCGPTQTCSGTTVLDFAKVSASTDNIDIVGFYHNYCAIQGLRSCTFEPLPAKTAEKDLFCSLPGIKNIEYFACVEPDFERLSFAKMRDNINESLFNAPFWKHGGILYAHLLLPHPLMGNPSKKLSEEYSENIVNSAALVKLVAENAKFAFKDDFKIIIFSDHPLRPDMWCAQQGYLKLGCEPDDYQISAQVPLIIATPTAAQLPAHSVTNNKFIFDLLF